MSSEIVLPIITPIEGTPGPDVIDASANPEDIKTYEGNDRVHARGGSDIVDAGEGNDTVFGGGGADLIDGGEGDDLILGGTGRDTIIGGEGADSIHGGAGIDTFVFTRETAIETDHIYGAVDGEFLDVSGFYGIDQEVVGDDLYIYAYVSAQGRELIAIAHEMTGTFDVI